MESNRQRELRSRGECLIADSWLGAYRNQLRGRCRSGIHPPADVIDHAGSSTSGILHGVVRDRRLRIVNSAGKREIVWNESRAARGGFNGESIS